MGGGSQDQIAHPAEPGGLERLGRRRELPGHGGEGPQGARGMLRSEARKNSWQHSAAVGIILDAMEVT